MVTYAQRVQSGRFETGSSKRDIAYSTAMPKIEHISYYLTQKSQSMRMRYEEYITIILEENYNVD